MTSVRHKLRYCLNAVGWELNRWRGPTPLANHLLGLRHVDLVLDVGANQGQFARGLRRGGYEGQIESFEPARAALDQLRQFAARDPRWNVVGVAVGDVPAVARLHEAAASDLSSLLLPEDRLLRRFPTAQEVRSYDVPVITLDDWWHAPDTPDAGRIFLKVDTQGYDLRVLRGASDVLPYVQVLQLEMSLKANYRGLDNGFSDVLEQTASLGFAPADFTLVNSDGDGAAEEFDGLFVRA